MLDRTGCIRTGEEGHVLIMRSLSNVLHQSGRSTPGVSIRGFSNLQMVTCQKGHSADDVGEE